jgi:ABC-2 type transport system permease protein
LTTIDNFSECLNISKVITIIPIFLVFIFLSFIGYSLLSAITASMTTNMEDYEQVSSPVVMINLVGYYLVIMASLFNGSLFIRILSYIPFISTMLSPALFILGQIGTVDVVISVIIMIGVIYLLIKYGLRIYKVGILNYSSSNIWKKMFKAIWNK